MASWIGGTEAQRFYQYIRPAARAALKRGDHEIVKKDILDRVAKLKVPGAEASDIEVKRYNRRLESLREEFRANERQLRRDLDVAERKYQPR